MEREAPPITIVDPHAQAGGGELLDVEPWRPTERQQLLGLAVAIVVLLVGGLITATEQLRRERAAQRAAVAALALEATEAPDTGVVPAGFVRVALRNGGPDAVRLLTARLVPGGYPEVTLTRQVAAGAEVTLGFPDTAPCEPLLTTPPDAVQLRLRTAEGTEVTRELPLSPGAYGDVNRTALERCGYLPAFEAFGFTLIAVDVEGSTVVLEALVFNDSVLPLTLDRLTHAPGLSLTTSRALPLVLPPQPGPGVLANTVPLTLRLRVTSCEVYVGTLGDQVLRAWVMRDASLFEVDVLGVEPTRSFRPPVDPGLVLTSLLQTCPSFGY